MKMRHLCIAAMLALLSFTGYAQIFDWATQGGGAGNAFGFSCAADTSGNIYTTGMFHAPGTFSNLSVQAGGDCFFVTKHNSSGSIQWAAAGFSPSAFCGSTLGRSITTDRQGNIYIIGSFTTSLLIESNYMVTSNNCDADIFIAKYGSNGVLVWAKQIMGNGSQNFANAICYDNAGHIYISGLSASDSLIFGNGQVIYNFSLQGGSRLFLAKLDTAGNCQWASSGLGGTSIAADAAGNVWATGTFMGALTQDAHTVNAADPTDTDIFISKYDSSGNVLLLEKAGGPHSDGANDIAVDAAGNAYVTGFFLMDGAFDNANVTATGMYDAFVAKYDANGNVVWVRTAGGAEQDYGRAIEIDAMGKVIVSGTYNDAISFGIPNVQASSAGMHDVFIARLDTAGNCSFVKTAGGPGIEEVWGLAAGAGDDVFISGGFESTAAFGANSITSTGGTFNMFLTRLTYEDVPAYNGLDEMNDDDAISVYPNPANDVINIKMNGAEGNHTVEVMDVCGKVAIRSDITSNEAILDLSRLEQGIYFIRVNNDLSETIQKIIVR